ncbi:MAG TPA: hypothetical protein ACFCUY_14885 [Xenococcaceae cyanobacterium]
MELNRGNINLLNQGDRLLTQIQVDENLVAPVVAVRQETQPASNPKNSLPAQPNIINEKNNTFLFLIPILLLTMGVIVKIGLQKTSKKQFKFRKYNSKIACRNCHFFDNNHYLKCAVHPDKVLTQKAQDCSDYQEKSD